MKALRIIFLIFVSACSVVSFAKKQVPRELSLLSHFEYTQLSPSERSQYVRGLIEIYSLIEKHQLNQGIYHAQVRPSWFLQQAIAAADEKSSPSMCNCGGFLTERDRSGLCKCQNCPTNKSQALCNPALFGEGTCVDKSHKNNITQACEAESREKVDQIATRFVSEKEDWDLIAGALVNYCQARMTSTECVAIHARVQALRAKAQSGIVSSNPPHVVSPNAGASASVDSEESSRFDKMQRIKNVCGAKPSEALKESCVKCPNFGTPVVSSVVALRPTSPPMSPKHARFVKNMADLCGVNNDSDDAKTRLKVVSEASIISRFGRCTESETGKLDDYFTNNDHPRNVKGLIDELTQNKNQEVQKAGGGLYYNKYSEAMQSYYGLNVKDAREIFCHEAGPDKIRSVLGGNPEFAFLYGSTKPTGLDLKELVEIKGPLKEMPMWAVTASEWPTPDGDKMTSLQNFKLQYERRQGLLKCFNRNQAESEQVSAAVSQQMDKPVSPFAAVCDLHRVSGLTWPMGAKDLAKLEELTKKGQVCVKASNGNNCRLTSSLRWKCESQNMPQGTSLEFHSLDCVNNAPASQSIPASGAQSQDAGQK